MTRIVLVWLALLLIGCRGRPSGAGEDLRELERFLEEVHPRPFTYVEQGRFDATVEAEAGRLDALGPVAAHNDADQLAVGLAFHRVLALVGDGHLAISLPVFDDVSSLIPLLVRRVGDTFFVDACSESLPRGTILERIEGAPIETLWPELEGLVLADGRGDAARRAQLEGL